MLQKIHSLFLSPAPTHHSFTFNLRFFYERKQKIRVSKNVCGIFHFRLHFVFIKFDILFLKKSIDSLTLKCHNFFQN